MKNQALFFIALFCSLQFAATNFALHYVGVYTSDISSDVNVQLSMGLLATTYCTGASITPNVSISSNWYSSFYSSKLASKALGSSEIVSYTSPNQPQRPITWTDSGDYTNLTNQRNQDNGFYGYFIDVPTFNLFMSGIGVSPMQSTIRSGYTTSSGGIHPGTGVCDSAPYCYKADIAFYCKGNTNIISNNDVYKQTKSDYLGQSLISFNTITLNTPGVFTFKPTFSLNGCLASGRTYLQNSTKDNVHLYHDLSSTQATFDTSATQTITVENPFTCSLSGTLVPTSTVTAGQPFTFQFIVKNDGSKPINVRSSSIDLVGYSFTGFSVNSANFDNLQPGATATFTGSATAPSTTGDYNLQLQVYTVTSSADCTGNVKSCDKLFTFPITVAISSNPTSCSLAFSSGHSATFTVPDSAVTVAICKNIVGTVVPCGSLAWSTTATGGAVTVNPSTTVTPTALSQTTLTISSGAAAQSALVKATHANFNCNTSFSIMSVAKPDYISSMSSSTSTPKVGVPFTITINTTNTGNAGTSTQSQTNLTSSGASANGVSHCTIVPGLLTTNGFNTNTCIRTINCTTEGPLTFSSYADGTYQITELNETNNAAILSVTCAPAPPVPLPDYISSMSSSTSTPKVGVPFTINVTTTNTGNKDATLSSQTNLTSSGASANGVSPCPVQPLPVNGFNTNTCIRTINCTTEGPLTFSSYADGTYQIAELNETNNAAILSVICTTAPPVLLPDYVSIIEAPPRVTVGNRFTINVTTRNNGAPAVNSSRTRLSISNQGSPIFFNIKPLSKEQVKNSTNGECTSPGPITITSYADIDNAVYPEESDNNNDYSVTVICEAAAALPDYTSDISAPYTVLVGTTFQVNVTTTNIGGAVGSLPSTTQLNVTGFSPRGLPVRVLLANSDSVTNTDYFTCPSYESYIQIKSFADLYGRSGETNRLNNNDTFTVHCVLPTILPNYEPEIQAPDIVFVGYSFTANITTKNTGSVNAIKPSITRAVFESDAQNFDVSRLSASARQTDKSNFTCTTEGPKPLVETVDLSYTVGESNEDDNERSASITCYMPPTSCKLRFDTNKILFKTGDLSRVFATCFYSGGATQTACPPFLWQQNAQGGSIIPANTFTTMFPYSTLLISGSVATQLERKVNATSTLPGMSFSCELPFNVSDGSPIGPDYVVKSIIPAPSTADLDETVQFTVTVTNQGNVNATNVSRSTVTYSSGCAPVGAAHYSLPALEVDELHVNSNFACICKEAGAQNITVTANPEQTQWETDFNNNARTQSFICQASALPPDCSYFV